MRHILLTISVLFGVIGECYAQKITPTKAESGKWGYTKNSQWIIPAKYDRAFSYSEDLALVYLYGKYGYINENGETAIPFRFDGAEQFVNGLAPVKLNGKWGYIDKQGNMDIPYKFDEAQAFSEGLAAVMLNGRWGFINRLGDTVIPYEYESANAFSDGLAAVRINRVWKFIDVDDNVYDTRGEFVPAFSNFAKLYVESEINKWQQKGRYEKTTDWQARVSDENRQKKISELTSTAEQSYIRNMVQNVEFQQSIINYDADNEVFLVKDNRFGNLLVPVPVGEAEAFEQNFAQVTRKTKFFINNDRIALAELGYTAPNGKTYTYNNSTSLEYSSVSINYNFEPVNLKLADTSTSAGNNSQITSRSFSQASDIDTSIPKTSRVNNNTFVAIIANEHYAKGYNAIADVPFAQNDGLSFQKYCTQTLGIPEQNIRYVPDATLNQMRGVLNWLSKISESFDDENILFYYSGHGIPDEKAPHDAHLIPSDGFKEDMDTCFKLNDLYDRLGQLSAKSVTVFLDACFSGANKDKTMLAQKRGVAITPKNTGPLHGNVVVLSASSGDETAQSYAKMGHGLFTYFLLKEIRSANGDITLGQLADNVIKKVGQASITENSEKQTPTVMFSTKMTETWRKLTLK